VLNRWDPWAELESRQHLSYGEAPLPVGTGGGVYVRWPDGSAVIVLDPRLLDGVKDYVLAHELVHDERPSCPFLIESDEGRAWQTQEESAVDKIAFDRMGPGPYLDLILNCRLGRGRLMIEEGE
jgi:hypothetical protein